MLRVRTSCLGIAAACLTLLAVPSMASAAAWIDGSHDLSAPGLVMFDPLDTTVADDGTIWAVWVRNDNNLRTVEVASRVAGGAWTAPQSLTQPGFNTMPQIASDADGTVWVTWLESINGRHVIRSTRRFRGGGWELTSTISSEQQDATSMQLVEQHRRGGDAVRIVWLHSADNRSLLHTRSARGGRWGDEQLSEQFWMEASLLQAAPGPTGIHVVFRVQSVNRSIVHGYLNDEDQWQFMEGISLPGSDATAPDVAVDGSNTARVVWLQETANVLSVHERDIEPVALRRTAVTMLRHPGQFARPPQVQVDLSGNTLVVWKTRIGANEVVYTSARDDSTGNWSAPRGVSDPQSTAQSHTTAVASDGTAYVMWGRFAQSGLVVEVIQRAPNSDVWSVPTVLSREPFDAGMPQLLADDHGNVFAFWQGLLDAAGRWQVRRMDGEAPSLERVLVPAVATAGVGVRLRASGVDREGDPMGEPRWSFDDGTPDVEGGDVDHVWSEPGTYHVRVSVADVSGSESSVVRDITIEATPAVAEPATKPSPISRPAVIGAPRVGVRLTCRMGAWSGASNTYAFRWQRKQGGRFVSIGRATTRRYRVRARDRGHRLRCVVIARNAAGVTRAPSVATQTIRARR